MARQRKSDEFRQEGFSLSHFVAAQFRRLTNLISNEQQGLHRSPSQRFWFSVRSILWAPFALLLMFLGFLLTSWSSSRSGWAFVWGLPALLTASGLFLSIGIANHFYRNIVYNRYEGSANNFLTSDRPSAAALCLERLVREQPNEPRYQFSLALAKQELGEEEESFNIMEKLAPLDRPGFMQAHQWMANEYVQNEELDLDDEARGELARKHLMLASRIDKDDLRVRLQLAFLLQEQGEVDEAIRLFKSIVEYEFPPEAEVSNDFLVYLAQAGPPLIKLYVDKEQYNDALRYQDVVVNKLMRVTARQPDNLDAWRLIVLCQLGTKNYIAATETITDARVNARSNEIRARLQALLADLFVEYASEMKEQDGEDSFTNQFRAIAQAVELNHRNPRAIDHLIELCISPHTESGETERLLQISSSSASISPLVLHVTLASRAAIAGRTNESFAHLKIANDVGPLAATVINTISIKLYFEPIDRPEDALKLINVALEVWPDIPNLNYTRGEIYLGLGRYEDALNDFKHALVKLPNHLPLRESLIKVYEQLGQPENAEPHRDELERLKNEFKLTSGL